MSTKEVLQNYFVKTLIQYKGELSIDESFLHDPPATMYWDFAQPKDLQLIGKTYMDEDRKRKSTHMRYFLREDL